MPVVCAVPALETARPVFGKFTTVTVVNHHECRNKPDVFYCPLLVASVPVRGKIFHRYDGNLEKYRGIGLAAVIILHGNDMVALADVIEYPVGGSIRAVHLKHVRRSAAIGRRGQP